MNLYKKLAFITIPFFLLNVMLWKTLLFKTTQETSNSNFYLLYLISFIFSVISVFMMQKVSQKSFENTGFVFILILTVKMVVYYFLYSSFFTASKGDNIEKVNFGIIVVLFLITDIFLANKILNRK